jgi:hypothetical protein
MGWRNLAFANKIVQLAAPTTTNGGLTSDVISLKNGVRATIVVDLKQAVGHASVVSVRQATDVAAGTNHRVRRARPG